MKSKIRMGLFLFILGMFTVNAQSYNVHSHNDYEQQVPFWKALPVGITFLESKFFYLKRSY